MLSDGTLALALGAGLVAALNPCGFALLPAYLSLFVLEEESSRPAAVWRAVRATAALTAGFAAVFAVFGLAIAPVAASVQEYLPGFTVVLGVVLAAAGAWVLAGRALPALPVRRPGQRAGGRGRPVTDSLTSMAGYGASYAVASLGCTIAPFLAVVVTAFRAGSAVEGMVLFLVYAGGMGLVVGTLAVAVALARQGVIGRVRRAGRFLPRVAGALLLVAGAYVAWYGVWELRVLHLGAGADPVVAAAGKVQQWLAGNTETVGAAGFLAVLVVMVGVALVLRRRTGSATPPTTPPLDDRSERTREKP